MNLTFVGGGQMARAMAGGILDSGVVTGEALTVVNPPGANADWWTRHRPGVRVLAPEQWGVGDHDDGVVVLAVKPDKILPLIAAYDAWKDRPVVSIAAGVTLGQLISAVGHSRVIRVMPNTPSLVGFGMSGYVCGDDVTANDRQSLVGLLDAIGQHVEVTERQLEALTGLSGSGPAYVYLMIEALADGGVAAGLPRQIAMQLATQTVRGGAEMVAQTGQHPGVLKDAVASPGGTTIAGISTLEQNGFRWALVDAVTTAAKQARRMAAQSAAGNESP
ncbi:MAG: pyrroline-5-carboxylate reductase [Planctomycetota bacterium]